MVLACSSWFWTIFAQVVRAVKGWFCRICRGIAAPIVIARPFGYSQISFIIQQKKDLCRLKIADLPLVVYTHHVWANTDIVNLAIIDGLTKNLLQEKIAVLFVYDVYQCIVADVEYFCCAFYYAWGTRNHIYKTSFEGLGI